MIYKNFQTEASPEKNLVFVAPDGAYFEFEPNIYKVRKEQEVILFTEQSQRMITSYDYNSFWKIGKYRQ